MFMCICKFKCASTDIDGIDQDQVLISVRLKLYEIYVLLFLTFVLQAFKSKAFWMSQYSSSYF